MLLRRKASVLALALTVAPLAACGGGSDSSSSGGSSNSAFDENVDSRGPITFVTGKDNSGITQPIADMWNKEHPDEKVTVKEQTDEANQQHDDDVRNFDAKNPDYDVISVDVVWTAEFAAKGYLQPLQDKLAINTDGMLQAPIDAGTYNNTLYGAPYASDGGMLYYRTDLVKKPPTTWDEMMADCDIAKQHNMDCYAGQFAKYEGLTVNASEAINGFGGSIVGDDGKTATVDSPEAAEGLGSLVDAFADGNIPAAAITYTEEEGRISFEKGDLLFLRNWPYVYSLAKTEGSSKVKDTFDVAPLPGKDGVGASSLGGHSLGISAYSDNKATAADFIKFFLSEKIQRDVLVKIGSLAPVLESLYTDKALVKEAPYLPTLLTSIQNAVPRPVTPFYPAVSQAITDNAYSALKGQKDVQTALKDMSDAIDSASSGSQ
jgi:multiple sugar transport system substrate-binding protein